MSRVVELVLHGLPETQSLLDIGTGSGVFAEAFAKKGLKVSGVDANPQMLPVAGQFVPAGDFKEAEAENLPYQDAQFDLAFMGLVLHETDDPLAALQEAHRVTCRRTAVLEWPDEDQPVGPPRGERLPEAKIRALAAEAGFKKVDRYRLETLILYLLSSV